SMAGSGSSRLARMSSTSSRRSAGESLRACALSFFAALVMPLASKDPRKLACPASNYAVAYHAALLRVVVRREAFAPFPFAELESIAQHVTESFCRRTPGVAGQLLQATLLCWTQYEGAHGEKSNRLTGSPH